MVLITVIVTNKYSSPIQPGPSLQRKLLTPASQDNKEKLCEWWLAHHKNSWNSCNCNYLINSYRNIIWPFLAMRLKYEVLALGLIWLKWSCCKSSVMWEVRIITTMYLLGMLSTSWTSNLASSFLCAGLLNNCLTLAPHSPHTNHSVVELILRVSEIILFHIVTTPTILYGRS